MKLKQKCSQYDSKGKGCNNIAEILEGTKDYYVDFCAIHNHMLKAGIPLKSWRCGDKYA